MGAHRRDLYREISSPSRGRDALIRAVSKGKLVRLLEHLDRHPADWRLVEANAGAVIEALVERADIAPDALEVSQLLRRVSPDRIYGKLHEIVERGQLDWAVRIVSLVMEEHPQTNAEWAWLLAKAQAGLKQTAKERQTLLGLLERAPDPELKIKVADRLLEIDAWPDGFTALRELYALPAWRDQVIDLLAKGLLAEGRWLDTDCSAICDGYWGDLLDQTARVRLWAQMLTRAGEQVAYDRTALTDGIDAMEACLKAIGGRDLAADSEQAQLGHELALKLMRFVRGLEPLEMGEQSVYMMLLDMLVVWETRWTERGIVLERSMEKELGSIWVDEELFTLALEILWEQFATQLHTPAVVSLQVSSDAASQTVSIALSPENPLHCTARQPLTVIDAAFVDRVMSGHGCQWRYEGEQDHRLSVTVSTAVHHVVRENEDKELEGEWLVCWQAQGDAGIATLRQQEMMISRPFRWGVQLAGALMRTLIADWTEQIRVIVHDLKNLFTFVQQWISQALSDPYSWTMAMERVTEIKARMHETLDEIRGLAVLGKPPLCEGIVLVELVRRVIENCRAFLEAHGVTCRIEQRAERTEIWADPVRLLSAITNLIKNGVEAMPGGGQLLITIDQKPEGSVQLIIQDTGVGIRADALPGLFTTGRSSKPGGSGVGLSAVARMLAGMGMEITVDSSLGSGARFIVAIPQNLLITHQRPGSLPAPSEQQSRVTQQALKAAAALYQSGDHKMTAHLWCRALVAQIETPLRHALPPVRARYLLAPITATTKRGLQQLGDDHRRRLQLDLGCSSKQLTKKSATVIQTLIGGDWDRLTHPLHWAILLLLFPGQDLYPWPPVLCEQMAQWLVEADMVEDAEIPALGQIDDLGTRLAELLELALPCHLGA